MDYKTYQSQLQLAMTEPAKALSIALTQMSYGYSSYYDPGEPFIDVNDYTIAAGVGTVLNNQQITLNLDFDIYVYAISAAPYLVRTTTPFSFLLKTGGGNVLFGNAPVRSDAIFSEARPVFFLRRPFKVARGVNLTVDLTNQSAGENAIQLVLYAWKSESAYTPT